MTGRRKVLLAFIAGAAALALAARAAAGSNLSDWAALFVAGDNHAAHTGIVVDNFDNARRDVATAFIKRGLNPNNIVQFSMQPFRFTDYITLKTDIAGLAPALDDVAGRAKSGCLVYFTSHGLPQGVLVAGRIYPPPAMDAMIDKACGPRPTVVVISACFSGVFVKPLARPNRLILTAARPDRTSFGCGEEDHYPFFDACMLEVLPQAADFLAIAPRVRDCITRRETETGASPPSEPQVSAGAALTPGQLAFDRPAR